MGGGVGMWNWWGNRCVGWVRGGCGGSGGCGGGWRCGDVKSWCGV